NASPRSERLILRTVKAVETPNNCSLGLANTVAMAPISVLVLAGENGAPSGRAHSPHARKSRLSPTNQIQPERALPGDTCRDRFRKLSVMRDESKTALTVRWNCAFCTVPLLRCITGETGR